ncbi:MAG: 4Fe-4S binding protein [Lachnospiraceae bacterium]|nr:4Fe-4S binding protein [Lachnospiraceae bacterium]
MNTYYHSVKLDRDLCRGCTTCLQHCPTEAIRIRDGKAQIDGRFCVDCGECIRYCPHHAKLADYDRLDVLDEFEYTVALPAPSLYMQFRSLEDTNIVLNALKEMGFSDVYEVSAAAELVSEATRKFLAEHDDGDPWISSACPSVVRLIMKRFPNLIDRVLPINPPIEVAARLAAKKAMADTGLPREKIGIIFISPCPAKMTYVHNPIGTDKSEVDRVVALKDVYQKILPYMKAVAGTDYPEIARSGKVGVSWGARGGEASGLFVTTYLAADGMENVLRVLDDIEDRKFSRLKFIELNACPGGCVGGVLAVENPFVSEVRLKTLRKYMPVSVSSIDENDLGALANTEPIEYEAVSTLGSTMEESFRLLGQAERIEKRLPGLDCGSCGAPNCKALSQDIVLGKASENDCVFILKDKIRELGERARELEDDLQGITNADTALSVVKEYARRLNKELGELDVE